MIIKKKCLYCNKQFSRSLNPKAIKRGKGKYCSRSCCVKNFYILREKGIIKVNLTGLELGRQQTGSKRSLETRKRVSKSLKGKTDNFARNWKGGQTKYGKYKVNICLDCRGKISLDALYCLRCAKKGNRAYQWKGGVTPINLKIRNSFEYKIWRQSVFERDNYTCQMCGDNKGGNLHANHIKKFSDYIELRLELTNGITLCQPCHINIVTRHEEEWESYFNFNLMTRGII